MKNKIVLFITIIVCFLLQCTIMDYISIGSITPAATHSAAFMMMI